MANLRVTELDFEQIKENLKDHLRSQSQFTDYDFEGSNLSILIDLLAYNTHYNAILANMVSNEMFLDTALKRSSVASLAKHTSYTPRSIISARSTVSLTLQNVANSPTFVTLEPYTQFSTIIDDTTYLFYNKDTYVATPSSGIYVFAEVELYQGRALDFYFSVPTTPSPATRYQIPNLDVDTQTLTVSVQYGGASSISETYTLMNDFVEARATSRIYYLEENTQGYYEIFFGDGILGKAPEYGDVVKINYLVSNGTDANVSQNTAITWTTASVTGESSANRSIATISRPQGGADKETTDQIRFNAINQYTTQGRAITVTDYASLISENLPGAQSVNVWGGEQNDPPEFGKIFISVKPYTGYVLTNNEKYRLITDVLQPRGIVTATHEFVDPLFTHLNFRILVKYIADNTNRTSNALASLTNQAVIDHIDNNLEKFDSSFYMSELQEDIKNIDTAIRSIIIVLSQQKRLSLTAGSSFSGVVQFPAAIHPGEVRSNYYALVTTAGTFSAQLRDVPNTNPPEYNGMGTLKIFDIISNNVLVESVGTVNYATGKLTISDMLVSGYIGRSTDIRISCDTQESSRDIAPAYNEILVLDDTAADATSNLANGITVEMLALTNKDR